MLHPLISLLTGSDSAGSITSKKLREQVLRMSAYCVIIGSIKRSCGIVTFCLSIQKSIIVLVNRLPPPADPVAAFSGLAPKKIVI